LGSRCRWFGRRRHTEPRIASWLQDLSAAASPTAGDASMTARHGRSFFHLGRLGWLVALAVVASALWLHAQTPTDAPIGRLAIDPATGQLPTLLQLFETSPIINGIIAGLSGIAVLLFLFFLLTINTNAMAPAGFVDDINKLIMAQKYSDAATLCRANRRIFIASIIQRCVENDAKGHSVIMDMLDAEGRRRADIIWNRISYLADVSNVAPMLGLLGTVLGMIKAFFSLDTESGSINSRVLTSGVGEAMATTMFGLIVGILALVFYSIIKSRATRTLAEAEQITHSIADHIKRGGL
jgi:biopolymer transport protein ExbB